MHPMKRYLLVCLALSLFVQTHTLTVGADGSFKYNRISDDYGDENSDHYNFAMMRVPTCQPGYVPIKRTINGIQVTKCRLRA